MPPLTGSAGRAGAAGPASSHRAGRIVHGFRSMVRPPEWQREGPSRALASLERGELVLGERLQGEVLELDLLRDLVRVQLEPDRRLLDPLRQRLAPVGDEHAV